VSDLDRESILALDNIRLDLPVAGVGSRGLAALIDGFFVIVLLIILLGLCTALMLWSRGWALAAMVAGAFLVDWGYFAGMEVATRGRTLGKMALDLRVVSAAGAEPTAGSLLLRNLVREIDLVIGLPLMAWDPLARRLGDRLAGTLVVHDRQREAMPVLRRVPPGWGAREVAVAERFVARQGGLHDPWARDEMALRLLALVERDAPSLVAGIDRRDPMAALRLALDVGER
jgi:uncharacterized RDD family membrane protein YckC